MVIGPHAGFKRPAPPPGWATSETVFRLLADREQAHEGGSQLRPGSEEKPDSLEEFRPPLLA